MFRIGFGQDSHRFSDDSKRKLILGGIGIRNEKGLKANSDGDVVAHAICRAIEQALGNQDFSVYADKMSREGINDSQKYLKVAMGHVKAKGYSINNLGITFECRKPKIIPIEEKMKKNLAEILKIEIGQIGINASSGEDLTAFGKGEGIQVFAIVSLIKI